MKKALIALSVAAGMIGAAQAENTTTLYGSLGYSTSIDKSRNESISGSVKENRWDLDTATAKFGIKGTEDLAGGVQAFYKMEFGFDVNGGVDNTRYAYLGLKGDFGTVTLGKQNSLFKTVTNYNDIFNDVFYSDELATFSSATGGSRLPKAISYVSPNFGGFQFGIAGVLDGSNQVIKNSASKDFDAAQAGIWYDQNGFYAGLAYSWIDADDNQTRGVNSKGKIVAFNPGTTEVVGGAIGYSNDQFKVGLGAQHQASYGEVYNLAGEYYFGPNTVRGGFSLADPKGDDNVYVYALGYQYNFSKRTYTWVEGEYRDFKGKESDGYTVKVGLRHDF
ncbi:porin [Suttonella ornithocola]|uniref:Outer membrane porin protein BP0840 n=1 Tax=Suttonella ornithocola TaxID=279832 RepID=A0A380MP45_9GAMM|nr:porin [Suttonella ornithocola]SUO93501.1 Outer membrane porin protein BP0840 precursor [Suttonella ornithocola]